MRVIIGFIASVVLVAYADSAPAQTAAPPAAPAAVLPPTVLPIEAFTKHDQFGGIKLSPTGEYAAYLTGRYGRSLIAIIGTKDKKMTGGGRSPDGFEIYDFHWVSNSRIVYEIAERQPGRVRPTPTGEMGALDFDSKSQRFIYGYRAGEFATGTIRRVRESSYATPQIISPLLSDDKHILIAEHPWRLVGNYWMFDRDAKPIITLLNVFTGAKRKIGVAPLINASMLVDRNDQIRFAIGRNKQLDLAVSWKQTPESPWTDWDLPGFREDTVIPRLISEDNQSVSFTGIRDDESLTALYSLNMTTKEITKVHAFADTDITDVVLDFSGKRIVGTVSYVDKPIIHWLSKEDRAARVYDALHRAFPNQIVHIETATEDGRIAVVLVSSDINPGDYFLFDTQTMKADYLQSARRWIKPEQMRPKEPFALQARDGVKLHGYITHPSGNGPYPLVVLPHGGPHGVRDYWDFDWEGQLLANRGYAVLQVNFRGSGGYGEKFAELGFRNWGTSMQDDVTDATRWAIEQKITAPDRICIYGASYGGYAALQGAVREPTLYRCAIGYAGVYDLELMLSASDIPLFKSGRAYLQEALGDDREQLRSRSPVYNADKIQIPVLLIHGKEDGRADVEHATRMKAALQKNKKQFEWMPLSREGHGAYDEETRREVYERILGFLDKHLKTPAQAAAR